MCGFMFCSDTDISDEQFAKAFAKIRHRGPDQTLIIRRPEGIWGFHRLAIMDVSEDGMQPFFAHDCAVVCNGELYGFRPVKKALEEKYSFMSESDCELLIPLYKEYGVKMFNQLDAEFACVLYDEINGSLLAARDPFGIRPMFIGYTKNNKVVFASEGKALTDLCTKVEPFAPGCYYQDGVIERYYDVAQSDASYSEMAEILGGIRTKLMDGVHKRMDADAPVGYLLSGGLDSSLVCAIASRYLKKPLETFSIGMATDAIDLKYAKIVADYIGSNHHEVIIAREDVINALQPVIKTLESYDITTIRASIGMYLLCAWIKENTDIKVLFTGEISDELFGYKYTDFAPSPQEFQKDAMKRVRELYQYDVLRADRCISGNGLEGRVPFGDLKFARFVMSIDPARKMNTYNMGKYLLRTAFKDLKLLPDSILFRDKAAFSDAVGHSLVEYLKEYAEGYYSDAEFEAKIKKYQHCPPYTKESLLYREIFEKFYPGHDDWISAYWLPNQDWEGSKVSDPSARYLSNYGDSGK
ncbi:MAG: asparagine synthase B [Erysipelotrichaceae bacterium]|nr:asparagine synthase B [Erysipelotrichaceae bacterium]